MDATFLAGYPTSAAYLERVYGSPAMVAAYEWKAAPADAPVTPATAPALLETADAWGARAQRAIACKWSAGLVRQTFIDFFRTKVGRARGGRLLAWCPGSPCALARWDGANWRDEGGGGGGHGLRVRVSALALCFWGDGERAGGMRESQPSAPEQRWASGALSGIPAIGIGSRFPLSRFLSLFLLIRHRISLVWLRSTVWKVEITKGFQRESKQPPATMLDSTLCKCCELPPSHAADAPVKTRETGLRRRSRAIYMDIHSCG